MKKQWTNFHQHSRFSLLDGHGTIENYAKRAKELQMSSLAITDHGNIYGWLDHYEKCKELDLKPILGIEGYQARKSRWDKDDEERAGPSKDEWTQRGPYHITILAKNNTGYHNLIKLSSEAYLDGFYVKPRMDHELIEKHSNGLIVMSGCLGGEVQQALLRGDFPAALAAAINMQEIVGKENYFIEMHNHNIPEELQVIPQLIDIARLIGAKIIPTGDCHYVNKVDAYHHDVMLCVGTKSLMAQEERFKFHDEEFYLKSYDEMAERFETEWLDNTLDVADMIEVNLEFGEFHFPKFPDVPKQQTPEEYLEELTWAGITERYGDNPSQEVIDQTNHELLVIKEMGFVEYFLVVGDLVRWAKDNGIMVGWGRGSAAGSIVSYALKITSLDPIRFGLIFERFLVRGRRTMPDIDLDFDDRYREKVIGYAREKYGYDRVAHIITFGSEGAKSAIKDSARVLGYEYSVGDKLSKMVPPMVLGVAKTLDEALATTDLRREYETDPIAKEILDAAKGIEGIYRQTGIHAAGVIIAPGPVSDYMPVMRKGDDAPMVSVWDMKRTEQIGLLKIDFLGLRNLGVIGNTVNTIKERHGIEIDPELIPLDDPEVFKTLCAGNTMGLFQIESSGMREMTMAVQPTCLEDIMSITSLYRPGPMGSGMDQTYINRKHGREKINYPDPKLSKVLSETYGVMLYQEDVLNVITTLAGWSTGEADDMRRVMGKKEMKKVGAFRDKFVEGCKTTSHVDGARADKVFSDIEYFAGYGFNRAHAASYAMVSYITAWFKYHYPSEYMAALLTSVATKKDKLASYLNECKKMEINVLPPSLAVSNSEFTVSNAKEIVFGLSAIDGMGPAKVDAVLLGRDEADDYTGLWDFFRRCDSGILNKATLSHLAKSGALDDLVPFESDITREQRMDLLEAEKNEIGIYVSDHPLRSVWAYIKPDISHEVVALDDCASKDDVRIGGIITQLEKKTTKKGQVMYIVRIEDMTGGVEVVIFPNDAARITAGLFKVGSIGVLSGRITLDGDEENPVIKVVYGDFEKIDTTKLYGGTPIYLKCKSKLSTQQLERLRDIIDSVNGDSPVYLEYPEGRHIVSLLFAKQTSANIQDSLQHIIDISEVDF